jgi:hypothetical protein
MTQEKQSEQIFMSKNRISNRKDGARQAQPAPRKPGVWIVAIIGLLAVATITACDTKPPANKPQPPAAASSNSPATTPTTPVIIPPSVPGQDAQTLTMDVNKAVMVTEELDFGGHVPPIAEALQQIERRYQPDDGQGRTFAILDAYGEPTPDGKSLHISMHVSSEKPGLGEIVFKRTGKVLWRSRIQPTTLLPQPKNLTIMIDNGSGKTFTVDGSTGPSSVLEANFKELGVPVKTIWPDGAEREVTFIYSACGCPVKAMVKRAGDRTMRTKEMPVIFPDDPAAVDVIKRIMKW